MDFGSRAAGMPALAIVEGEVQALIYEVFEELVAGEVPLGEGVEMVRLGRARGVRGVWNGDHARASRFGRRQLPVAP
jgi:hypothetical protein